MNDDGRGGLAPDPMVWSAGGKRKRRKPIEAVRDYAMLPGPQRLWTGGWFRWPVIIITEDDVARWPFSSGCLVKLAAFLSSLSWPAEVVDLGVGGVSYVELLILYERWAGERLRIEESIPKYRRPRRPISVSAAPLCPDAYIWKLCRYLGHMLRALVRLPGGLGRFLPERISTNHGRLRHVGWEKCCHGLLVGPGNPLEKDSFLIFLAYLGILLALVLLCWMVPLSCGIIPFLLPTKSLLGGFLLVVRFTRSLQVLGPLSMHLV